LKTRSVLIHIDFCCDFTWIVGSAMDEGIPEVGNRWWRWPFTHHSLPLG